MLQRSSSHNSDAVSSRRVGPFFRHWIRNVSTFSLGIGNSSNLSLGTVNTALPEYTSIYRQPSVAGDDLESHHQQDSHDGGLQAQVPPPGYRNLQASTFVAISNSNVGQFGEHSGSPSHQFHYQYSVSVNQAWATLHLHTRDSVPGNATPFPIQPKVPRVWGCDPIAGVLELDLDSPRSIQQIQIILKGRLQTSSLKAGSHQFMARQFTLWKQSYGDPRQFLKNESSQNKTFDGKFIGKYTFPFSFPFPGALEEPAIPTYDSMVTPFQDEAELTSSFSKLIANEATVRKSSSSCTPSVPSSRSRRFGTKIPGECITSPSLPPTNNTEPGTRGSCLPPSFTENRISATIVYELYITLVHGRFKRDSKIRTKISYLPALHPPPSSKVRQQAYESRIPIPGPVRDPTGWFALPQVTSFGMFLDDLGQRQAKIGCTIYLALPLSYTRGSVIPCHLRLFSDDDEVLSQLATPRVPVVRLLRRLRYFEPDVDEPYSEKQQGALTLTGDMQYSVSASPIVMSPETVPVRGTSNFRVVGHEVAKARWRIPLSDAPQQNFVRHLEGEIHLREDLLASSACTIFHVQYFVEMLALRSDDFESSSSTTLSNSKAPSQVAGRHVIASVPVEITTLYRPDELIPVPFSEPPRRYMKPVPLGEGDGQKAKSKNTDVVPFF